MAFMVSKIFLQQNQEEVCCGTNLPVQGEEDE